MRRNQSLPPNKQPRATMLPPPSKSRAASMAPQPDQRPMIRDVKSKAFMSRAVTCLVEFLDSSDYPNDISTRILQSPNAKEVFCIFEHLVRQVDPLFRLKSPGLKVEELCANILRELGYPYVLSKQYLATPGAPHAWPSVLAALDWLREEVVEFQEQMASCLMFKYDDDQDKEQEPVGRVLYEISLSAYRAQLQGEQLSESIVEQYRCRMSHLLGCVNPDQLRQLESQAHELETELCAAGGLDTEIEELRAQLSSLDQQMERAHEARTRFELQIEQLEPELRQNLTETASLAAEKSSIQKKLSALKKQLEEQEAAGYGRLAEEYLMLTERYNSRLKAKSEVVRETEQLQLEFSRREGRIAPALDAFNRLISSIRAPGFEQTAKDCDLQIRTYQAGFDFRTDLPAVAQAAQNNLDRFRSAVLAAEQRVSAIGQSCVETLAAIEKLDVVGARAQLTELQEQVDKLNDLLQAEDAANAALERELCEQRQAASIKAEQLHSEEAAKEERLAELKATVEKENNTLLSAKDFLEEVNSKMAVLVPRLQGIQERKQLCEQMWEARVNTMRAQLRRATDRMESKVERALAELNELCTADTD